MNSVTNNAAIERIISLVVQLPTTENSQPWEIVVRGNVFEIFHLSVCDQIGSIPDDLSVLSAGIMAEAIDLAASTEGFTVHIEYFLQDRCDKNPWLRATLQQKGRAADPLAAALPLRHSDRRHYAGAVGSITDPVFKEVEQQAQLIAGTNFYLTNNYPQEFLHQTKLGDDLLFLCQDMRRDFMRWLRFTEKQIQRTRDGMSWRSLLHYPERPYHYLQSRLWWLAITLDWFPSWMMKLEAMLFDDSANLSPTNYEDCTCLGCITTASSSLEDLAAAGRLALRAWLLLNLRGYSFQAMTNLTSIVYPQHLGHWDLPTKMIPELAESYAVLQRMFDFSDTEIPIFCFRTGFPIAPYPKNARTLRRKDRVRFIST